MLLLSLAFLALPIDSAIVRDIEVADGETLRTTSVGTGRPIVLIPGLFGGAFSVSKRHLPRSGRERDQARLARCDKSSLRDKRLAARGRQP